MVVNGIVGKADVYKRQIFAPISPFIRLTNSLAIDNPSPVDVLLLAASAL